MLAIDLPHARRLAFGVVLGQAGVTLIAALAAAGLAGQGEAWSAPLGGGIATGGSVAMVALVIAGGAAAAPSIVGAAHRGEVV